MVQVLEKNKTLYNKLLKEQENGKIFKKGDLNKEILYELAINEDVIDNKICKLFNITQNQLKYLRKKYGMQNIFLLKMLDDNSLKDAYEKVKETNPNVDKEKFAEIYYKTLMIYGRSRGWNKEYMKKVIPHNSDLLKDYKISKQNKMSEPEYQDFNVIITKRSHIGNKIRKSKSTSNGRKNNQSQNNKSKTESGKLGEKIVVLDYEKKKLQMLGINKEPIWCTKTDDSDVTYDGLGYDVISYNEKNEPIYIEVKTSVTNTKDVIFDISEKEVRFMHGELEGIDKEHCFIYYVYNVNKENSTANIEIIDSETFASFVLKPTMYRVEEIFE